MTAVLPGLDRLAAALQVCEHVAHLAEPTDAEHHAAQQASGAWASSWRPEDVFDDLPGFEYSAGRCPKCGRDADSYVTIMVGFEPHRIAPRFDCHPPTWPPLRQSAPEPESEPEVHDPAWDEPAKPRRGRRTPARRAAAGSLFTAVASIVAAGANLIAGNLWVGILLGAATGVFAYLAAFFHMLPTAPPRKAP